DLCREDRFVVEDQVSMRRIVGERIAELLNHPTRGRVPGHVEVKKLGVVHDRSRTTRGAAGIGRSERRKSPSQRSRPGDLGFLVGRNTIKRVLADNGIDPAGQRSMSWKTFLKAHWGAIAATDFFTIEAVTGRGLIRYFVLFVIDLQTRRVQIAG